MSEQNAERKVPPAKEAATAVLVCDRLYHGQFETVMSASRHSEFMEFLHILQTGRGPGGVAEIALQLMISETPEELSEPDNLHWVAVIFDGIFQEKGTMLECKGVVAPKDGRDIMDIESLKEMACFTLPWQEIAWDQFDWQADAHE